MNEEKNKLSETNFEKLSVLGEGTYAKVLLVRRAGKVYAMKIMKKKILKRKKTRKTSYGRKVNSDWFGSSLFNKNASQFPE